MYLCAYILVFSFQLSYYTLVFLSEQYLTISGMRLQGIYMRVSLFGLFARCTMPCKVGGWVLVSIAHRIVLYDVIIACIHWIILYGGIVVNIFKSESY